MSGGRLHRVTGSAVGWSAAASLFVLIVPASVAADEPPSGVSMFSGGRAAGTVSPDAKAIQPHPVSHVRRLMERRSGPQESDRAKRLNEEGVELVLQGEHDAGAEKISAALQLDPQNTTALYNLAGVRLSQSRTKEAIALMEQAVQLQPHDLAFLTRLGESHFADSNVPRAIYYFEQVMAEDPAFGETAFRLGTLYAMVKQWDAAERTLRKAVDLRPKDLRALSNLGNVLVVRERFDDAIKVLEQAQRIKKTPENSVALGIAFEAKKDTRRALQELKEARRLGDRSAEVAQHIEELERSSPSGSARPADRDGDAPATGPAH